MKLIDRDNIPWIVDGVGEIPVITKEEIYEMPILNAIPIEWIEDWLSDRSILWGTPSETSIKQMMVDWQAEQESRNE